MLNDFQQKIYNAVSQIGLLEYEQATLQGGKIVFPICGGNVEIEIPEAIQHFVWARSTAPNGAMTEHDLRRAATLASALADARDGKPVHQYMEVLTL